MGQAVSVPPLSYLGLGSTHRLLIRMTLNHPSLPPFFQAQQHRGTSVSPPSLLSGPAAPRHFCLPSLPYFRPNSTEAPQTVRRSCPWGCGPTLTSRCRSYCCTAESGNRRYRCGLEWPRIPSYLVHFVQSWVSLHSLSYPIVNPKHRPAALLKVKTKSPH